jgi:hypothetical protein
VLIVVARKENAPRALGMLKDAACRLGRECDWLLAQHVEAMIEGGVRDLGMDVRGGGDVDEVEALRLGGEQGLLIRVYADVRRESASCARTARIADVRDRYDGDVPAGAGAGEVGRYMAVSRNESVTYDAPVQCFGHV